MLYLLGDLALLVMWFLVAESVLRNRPRSGDFFKDEMLKYMLTSQLTTGSTIMVLVVYVHATLLFMFGLV